MELLNSGWFYIYALLAIYLMYRIFFKTSPQQKEYERMYHNIVNSDKNKAKGQWKQ
jgi:hypothetical protein